MEYHLEPPLFMIEPQTNFPKAWEEFCRQLLNLEHHTTEIRHRTHPEYGIDLLWEKEGIAFQCKTVENGQAGSFNMSKALGSIQSALDIQSAIGWQKYIICTNVDFTGKQELKLRHKLPTIDFYTRGYWIDLCKKFHNQVADRFKVPIQVSYLYMMQALDRAYIRNYEQRYPLDPSKPPLPLLFYSKIRQQIFELNIPSDFTISDLLLLLRDLFNLTDPVTPVTTYPDMGISFSLKYTLAINDQEVPSYKKLNEFVSEDRPLVTLWKIVTCYQQSSYTELRDLEHTRQLNTWIDVIDLPSQEPLKSAVERFNKKIDDAFTKAIKRWE